jgi:hypothetical protein
MLKLLLAAAATSFLLASPALARDDHLQLSIKDALANDRADEKLDGSIKMYFGDAHPDVATKLGTFTSNRKTNAFNKSDLAACNWAFLSAVRELQHRAKKEGGNAVINITSVYRGTTLKSASQFTCGAGALMAGVALKGTVVKLSGK